MVPRERRAARGGAAPGDGDHLDTGKISAPEVLQDEAGNGAATQQGYAHGSSGRGDSATGPLWRAGMTQYHCALRDDTLRISILEDDPDQLALLKRWLAEDGHDVHGYLAGARRDEACRPGELRPVRPRLAGARRVRRRRADVAAHQRVADGTGAVRHGARFRAGHRVRAGERRRRLHGQAGAPAGTAGARACAAAPGVPARGREAALLPAVRHRHRARRRSGATARRSI